MTAGRAQVRVAGNLTRGYVDQINAIAQDAAQADNAGKWGIDGWVRLIHNLLDLQMRTCATAVDIALAGPKWWLEQPSTDPGPSDPVTVPKTAHPCTISIVEPLRRVGRPDIVVPAHAVHFLPDALRPGATSFQIRLTDEQYAGASYVGKVRLRRSDGAGRDSSTVSFTVGL
jgi:hypothetical protein